MRKIVSVFILFMVIFMPQIASAHVLITDEKNSTGAILHITPDDDPIAGQEATIYFDTQNRLPSHRNDSITLEIIDSFGERKAVDTKISGNLATATYVFPSQGAYELLFTVTADNETHIFKHSQRVSRGTSGDPLNRPTYAWAEISLIVCGSLFLVLFIVAVNNRKDIAVQSKW